VCRRSCSVFWRPRASANSRALSSTKRASDDSSSGRPCALGGSAADAARTVRGPAPEGRAARRLPRAKNAQERGRRPQNQPSRASCPVLARSSPAPPRTPYGFAARDHRRWRACDVVFDPRDHVHERRLAVRRVVVAVAAVVARGFGVVVVALRLAAAPLVVAFVLHRGALACEVMRVGPECRARAARTSFAVALTPRDLTALKSLFVAAV